MDADANGSHSQKTISPSGSHSKKNYFTANGNHSRKNCFPANGNHLQENLSVPTVYRNTNTAMALFPRERHPFAEKIFLKLLLPSPKTRTATVNRFRRMICCCLSFVTECKSDDIPLAHGGGSVFSPSLQFIIISIASFR